MSHGLPDYFRGVDIAYQALSEMIIRPKYGAAQLATAGLLVDASTETDLVSVSAKGMIYGGFLWLDEIATQANSTPKLYVDGVLLAAPAFSVLNKYQVDKERAYIFYELRYDNAVFVYSLGIMSGLTFETSFKLSYDEAYGRTPLVYARVIYAVI